MAVEYGSRFVTEGIISLMRPGGVGWGGVGFGGVGWGGVGWGGVGWGGGFQYPHPVSADLDSSNTSIIFFPETMV